MSHAGSSPRMRGARPETIRQKLKVGIIPADAGSTIQAICRVLSVKDHPRGCGEHDIDLDDATNNEGSSPRMRGAQMFSTTASAGLGIIPADAGSTLKDHCNPNTMIDKISDF